jgi:flagellin FlaB
MKKILNKLLKQKRGMVGIEAAIVLIAFVIVAAAFSFMVVNMGLFSTQRGREAIQQGISESGSPLMLDGSILLKAANHNVTAFMIPLKTLGVKYVPMKDNTTEITLRVETHTAIANCYGGINTAVTNPTNQTLDALVTATGSTTGSNATLFIGNSNGDTSLNSFEKGYLVFSLANYDQAAEREHVFVEIRPETGAPLTVDFIVPPQLTSGWLPVGS